MDRRTFLTGAAGIAGTAALRLGANERVRVGVIGSGGRGQLLTGEFVKASAEVAAVCDVYEPNLQAALKAASPGARSFASYKRLLDDKTLDAVVIATPDHWHANMAVDAIGAGKDVYLEKPIAHTIEEGFRIVAAVRRSKQVLQVGTQRRSFDLYQEAKQLVDAGSLGDVRLVNAWWVNYQSGLNGKGLGGKLDWEQWLGPAPHRELDTRRLYNWYYFWDYSGGMMVGQAAHIIDEIHWFMNSTFPAAVTAVGGRVNIVGAEVPETTSMIVEYPENYMAVFTVGYKAMKYNMHNDQMVQFHGARARFDMARESYELYPQSTQLTMSPALQLSKPNGFGPATSAHVRNFLDCVRTRKEPNAPIEAGNATNVVLCMAMQSLRAGRRLQWDATGKRVVKPA